METVLKLHNVSVGEIIPAQFTLEDQVKSIETDINNLKDWVSNNSDKIATIEIDVKTLECNVDKNSQCIEENKNIIIDLKKENEQLSKRVKSCETNILILGAIILIIAIGFGLILNHEGKEIRNLKYQNKQLSLQVEEEKYNLNSLYDDLYNDYFYSKK